MAEIGFIGMGNMGLAILHGLLKTCEPGRFIFTAVHAEKMAAVTEATGVPHAESNRACAQSCKYLILAVKPQYFDVVFDEIREGSGGDLPGSGTDHFQFKGAAGR